MSNRILLLSAYDAQSHRHWRLNLKRLFTEYDWTQLTLPPRHFSWRIRGNSLSWGFGERKLLSQPYDALVVTSMVDLASLRGFIPALAQVPSIVYFHENQFAYPQNDNLEPGPVTTLLDAQMVSIYSALCADIIVFNSLYNKNSFLAGARHLLKKLPDCIPPGLMEKLEQAEVVPVPLSDSLFASGATAGHRDTDPGILNVAWNHRWEYDKGPELLLQLVESVCREKLPVKFSLFGQQFRNQPEVFNRIKLLLSEYGKEFPSLNAHLGYIKNRDDYYAMLHACDVVLSTSLHDFQGLAILEAAALGCTPLTPNSLVYPEYLDEVFMYTDSRPLNDIQSLAQISNRLKQWSELKAGGKPLPKVDISRFSPINLKKDYLALFDRLIPV